MSLAIIACFISDGDKQGCGDSLERIRGLRELARVGEGSGGEGRGWLVTLLVSRTETPRDQACILCIKDH